MKKNPEKFTDVAATVLFKDDGYWMFHNPIIENNEQEKTNPGEKLWLVMRHMMSDPDHAFVPE